MQKKFLGVFLSLFLIPGFLVYAEEIDLIARASSARWINSDRTALAFGADGQAKGTIKYMENVKMEDGQSYEKVLFTHPQWRANGTLSGSFENIRIPENGGKLIIAGGLLDGTSRSDGVTFSAHFIGAGPQAKITTLGSAIGGPGVSLCSFSARYDQRIDRIECDLARFSGQAGILTLMVSAGNSSDSDSAAWTEAKLIFGEAEEKTQEEQILFLKTLTGHQNRINGVNFSPDGKYLVTAGGDGYAKVWEVDTGNMILDLGRHAAHVFQATFSPDSRVVATAGANYARIWEVPGGRELRAVGDFPERVNAVNFSPGGDRLLTAGADGTVKVWDWRSENEILSIEITDGEVYYACFSPDGRLIAAGSHDGLVSLWDANSGQLVRRLSGHSRSIPFVSFNRSGNRLVTVSGDNTARVWDVGNGSTILTLSGHLFDSAVFSPDGKYILSGNEDGKVIVWNASDGKEVITLHHTGGTVHSVAFSPDGRHFASGGENREAKIWQFNLK